MSGKTRSLTGRWLPHVAALALIALTVSLGNWQMRRAAEKAQVQAQIDRALAAEPVAVGPTARLTEQSVGTRVAVTGRWLNEHTVFIDNRTWRGRAGFHVLTPIRIVDSNQFAVVLRGWVASDPARRSRLPALPEGGAAVSLTAWVEADLAQTLELARSPVPGPDDRLWQSASLARFANWSGLPIAPVLLRQTSAEVDDGLVRDWPVPGAGAAKHHGYAAQWYALALLTAGLWLVLTIRQRNKTSR
jgi:surfeit locus 1 family protein